MTVLHCHKIVANACEVSARAAVRKLAPLQCRERRVWTPKDETGDHLGLAVKYRFTGNEPARYREREKKELGKQGRTMEMDRETYKNKTW